MAVRRRAVIVAPSAAGDRWRSLRYFGLWLGERDSGAPLRAFVASMPAEWTDDERGEAVWAEIERLGVIDEAEAYMAGLEEARSRWPH